MSDQFDSLGRRCRPAKDAWKETTSIRLVNREPWVVQSSCAGHPSAHLFFADRGDTKGVTEARKICADCLVWNECLGFAVKNHELYGIWGGLTSTERRMLFRTDQVKRCNKCHLLRPFFDKAEYVCDPCKGISLRQRKSSGLDC